MDAIALDVVGKCAAGVGLLWMIYLLTLVIFNLYFHPISRFPGPRWWAATRFAYLRAFHQGTLMQQIQGFHEKYGHVVRIGPDELSFTSAGALKDIYGSPPGMEAFHRNPNWYGSLPGGAASIISSGEKDHARMRRLVSHGFSDKALKEQEPLITGLVDLFVRRLQEQAQEGGAVDIIKWYNFVTFDVIGDLIFGEPFNCLQDNQYHPWVLIVYNYIKAIVLLKTANFYPMLQALIIRCIPKRVLQEQRQHDRMTKIKVQERLNLGSSRTDIIEYILQHNDQKGMTVPELEETLVILILAGSETTATALSGITNYLVRNKRVLQRLTDELRSAYHEEKEMTMTSLAELAYLTAVIEEGLRLCPPVPTGLSRVVPKGGGTVCGYHLPEKTVVAYHTWSAHQSAANFSYPNEFLPERWLAPSSSEPSPFAADVKDAFGPFSVGRNNCLGKSLAYAEMRLILARLLWNFDLEFPGPLSECPNWWEQKTFTLMEKAPLPLRLRPVDR